MTDFILDSACHAPEQTLLDQRLMVSGSQYSALMDLLDQPPRSNAGLRDLWRALMISDQAGIRALLTHPMDEEAARFYSRFGFEPSPLREDQLLLVLKDARRLVAGDF